VATLILAALAAWGVRRIGLRGGAILAGLSVGVLLGPGVLGRIAPDAYHRFFDGSRSAAEALAADVAERNAFVAAATASGAGEASVRDGLAELAAKGAAAESRWNAERAAARFPGTLLASLCLAVVLLSAGRGSAVRRRGGEPDAHLRGEAALLAGWMVVVPAILTVPALLLWQVPLGSPTGLTLLAVMACGAWAISRPERAIARTASPRAAEIVESAGRIASLLAGVVIAVTALPTAPWLAAAVLLLPLGWVVRPPLVAACERVALPTLVALLAVRIEPFRDGALWPMLVLYLIAEDGRWLAAAVGHAASGRYGPFAAMRLAIVGLASGPLMVAFAAIVSLAGQLDPTYALAVLVAAAATDGLTGPRQRVAVELLALERKPPIAV
jgi:hypothetical protein